MTTPMAPSPIPRRVGPPVGVRERLRSVCAKLARAVPRSLAGWFAVCWGLFLAGAIIAGAALVSLYQEGTAERLRRAEAAVVRGCESVAERYRFETAGSARIDWMDPNSERALTAANLLALRDLPGVEGGLWRSGAGPL